MQPAVVVDIGARYGLHPSWKGFPCKSSFHLVEPDPIEAARLRKRYEETPSVLIHEIAILNYAGLAKLIVLNNPAMSGTYSRENISPLYWENGGGRQNQTKIQDTIEVACLDLNAFRIEIGSPIDFLKVDTEGSEFEILQGFNYFDELLGLRSEVCFDRLFSNIERDTFSDINGLMRDKGFILLNLDYSGQGDFYSNLVSASARYGVLQATDAVWIKNPRVVAKSKNLREIVLTSLFLFQNSAPDVALWLIKEAQETIQSKLECENVKQLKYAVVRHLYSIKWEPCQSIVQHKEFFEQLFLELYPSSEKYNESPVFNPLETFQ